MDTVSAALRQTLHNNRVTAGFPQSPSASCPDPTDGVAVLVFGLLPTVLIIVGIKLGQRSVVVCVSRLSYFAEDPKAFSGAPAKPPVRYRRLQASSTPPLPKPTLLLKAPYPHITTALLRRLVGPFYIRLWLHTLRTREGL